MNNSINNNLNSEPNISAIISQDSFSNLEPDLKNLVITTISKQKTQEKSAGKFGVFFGTEPSMVSMNIGLVICGLLFIILVVDLIHSLRTNNEINIDLIKTILPTFTLYLGYLFGKSPKE